MDELVTTELQHPSVQDVVRSIGTMINQSADPEHFYEIYVVFRPEDIQVFDCKEARLRAWSWTYKYGGVVMRVRMNRATHEVEIVPDKKPI